MEIGLKIRQLRKEKNLPAESLAKEIGVTKESIYGYEKGRVIPPIEKLELLARVLNVSLDYFINENTKIISQNTKQNENEFDNLRNDLLTFKGVLIGKGLWQDLKEYFPKYKHAKQVA